MGGEVSTDSKSSNRIEISRFIQVLLHFYWFGGVPPGGSVGGCVCGIGWGHPPHTCACTRAHTCAHTCMHVKHDKHGCLHGDGHLQFPNMFILVFRARACMDICVHMSGNTPHAPRCPQPICPLPRATGTRREPESPKVYKSWTNQDNSILFEKSLPLTFLNSSRLTLITLDAPHSPAPPPWSQRSPNLKNAIKHERIEIIDPWALLHKTRSDVHVGGGGVSHPKWPKKVHVFRSYNSLDKTFPVFALNPTRACLDWQLSWFLTS